MGQAERELPEASALIEGEEASIGAYLAGQRRLRGISLETLAEETRIPRRALERLEAGALDGTRDGFARGFVRTVAEALGLDPDQAVARMLPEPALEPPAGGGSLGRALRSPLVWVALAVVVLSGVGLWVSSARLGPVLSDDGGAPLPHRRDAVRELAESLEASSAPEAASPR